MEASSLMHRTNKASKLKIKNFHHDLKNHCLKTKRSISKNNNHHAPNGEHHKHHHNLASHYRNRHISPRVSALKHGKHNAKLNDTPNRIETGKVNGNLNVNGVALRDSVSTFEIKYGKNGNNEDAVDSITGTSIIDRNGDDGKEYVGDKEETNLEICKDEVLIGNFTREVYNAICLRLGDTLHIPENSVKVLFNDMHLFPSDIQVTKMLQCARQYSRRNGTNPNYLTFGEFCVFVREMQNHPSPKLHRKSTLQNSNKCPNNKCEVFLGGSCNPTTWRADTAIPELQKHGISFYNPQVSMWAPELLAQEHDAKQSASVLLFVIDSQTRSTVGMLEVAYLVACGRCVIVVAQPYRIGQTIMGEVITDREYYDLVQGQKSLLDLIKSKGVQIHTSLSMALQCTADILRNVSVNGTSPEEQVTNKLRRLREVYDSYNGQMHIDDVMDAYRRLTNRSLEISKLYNYFHLQNGTGNGIGKTTTNGSDGATLSFEKFCAVMAELSTDGCGMCNIEAWATQTFTRSQHTQCSTAQNRSKCSVEQPQVSAALSTSQEPLYDVYLGGSLATGTKWRELIAIPLLKQNGLQYYNPAIREATLDSPEDNRSEIWQDDVSRWRHEIGQCKVALFVITNDTRSLTSMILAAHYIGIGKDVVVSMEQLNSESCIVSDETLTKIAIKDYNRARAYLRDLAERRQIPVCDSVEDAVTCVVSKLSKSRVTQDSSSRTEPNR